MKVRSAKIVKVFGWIILVFLVLIIATTGILYFKGQSYLNTHLSQYVLKKTNGQYSLSFDKLELDFKNRGFKIDNISILPTDTLVATGKDSLNNSSSGFYCNASQVIFRRIHLFKLIRNKKLIIDDVIFEKPDIGIEGEQIKDKDKLLENILPKINRIFSGRMHSILIKKIELNDANYDIRSLFEKEGNNSSAESLTVGIENFYTDSLTINQKDQFFTADDVFIQLNKYMAGLSDSIHQIQAESVIYSLEHSYIVANNIVLKPQSKEIINKNLYFIKAPKLILKSRYIQSFFENDSIFIDSLTVEHPDINVYPKKQSINKTIQSINNFDLYDLVKSKVKQITIEHFNLKNSHLQFFNSINDSLSQQEFGKLTIELSNFILDSTSAGNTEKLFYADNFELGVDDYKLILGDKIHTAKASHLSASTIKKSIELKGFSLNHTSGKKIPKSNVTIESTCDSLLLKNIDFKVALHQRKLPLEQINIFNPEITINQFGEYQKNSIKGKESIIYTLISEYIKAVYCYLVMIDEGRLRINTIYRNGKKGYAESGFNFTLTDFSLDSISARKSDKIFFATNIDLNFSNYKMQLVDQLHRLSIEDVSVSSSKNMATIKNFHLTPVAKESPIDKLLEYNRSELYDFFVPSMVFSNTNVHKAFFNKKLSIGSFTIDQPKIYFESFAFLNKNPSDKNYDELFQLLSNYLEDIEISNIHIPEGKISLINHSKKGKTISFDNHFSLQLENMKLNEEELAKRRILFSDEVKLSVRDHLFKLSDNVHYLKAGEFGFSTQNKELHVNDALLYPDITSDDYQISPLHILISVPKIRLNGVNMLDAYFDQTINVNDFSIQSPTIKLYRKNQDKGKNNFKEASLLLPKEIETLLINHFILNNGKLNVIDENGAEQYQLAETGIEIESSDINIKQNNESREAEFHNGILKATLENLKLTPKGKNRKYSIAKITYSTDSENIKARQLSIQPKQKLSTENQFEIQIPSLRMNSFNIDQAYNNNFYLFDEITLEKPTLTLYRNEIDSLTFNPYNTNLYPYFEDFADVFAAKSIYINDAGLYLIEKNHKHIQDNINLQLHNLWVDNSPSEKFLCSGDFAINIKNITRTDKKNLYKFHIGEIDYSSKTNHFIASQIQIKPEYSKSRFQKIVKLQTDYFKGSIYSIIISAPELPRWFNKKELVAKQLSINQLNLDVFRDKRIPFNEAQHPKMPQNLMKEFDIGFYFDSLLLINSAIEYSEQLETQQSSAKINFSEVNASIYPFTNLPYLYSIKPLNLVTKAFVMDSVELNVAMTFDMNTPQNEFEVTGSLTTPFGMDILNPVTEPAALISIRSGIANRFEFHFNADNTSSRGKLKFAYDDFHVSILSLKDGNTKESKFASFLANNLMLRSKNPRGKILLPDDIYFERDEQRSILNYWWKSTLSGIKNTFGIKENK